MCVTHICRSHRRIYTVYIVWVCLVCHWFTVKCLFYLDWLSCLPNLDCESHSRKHIHQKSHPTALFWQEGVWPSRFPLKMWGGNGEGEKQGIKNSKVACLLSLCGFCYFPIDLLSLSQSCVRIHSSEKLRNLTQSFPKQFFSLSYRWRLFLIVNPPVLIVSEQYSVSKSDKN